MKHAAALDVRWTYVAENGKVSEPSVPRRLSSDKALRTTRPLSVVLRAVASAASERRIAGRVEVVDTGEVFPIRDIEDLVELLYHLAVSAYNDAE